jgi:hypothetical protein
MWIFNVIILVNVIKEETELKYENKDQQGRVAFNESISNHNPETLNHWKGPQQDT